MVKLLRRNGKLQAVVLSYQSTNVKGPLNVVFPKKPTKKLPKTATKAMINFFDAKTYRTIKRHPIIVKAETAKKMDLQ